MNGPDKNTEANSAAKAAAADASRPLGSFGRKSDAIPHDAIQNALSKGIMEASEWSMHLYPGAGRLRS
jgi:hypothetical protein